MSSAGKELTQTLILTLLLLLKFPQMLVRHYTFASRFQFPSLHHRVSNPNDTFSIFSLRPFSKRFSCLSFFQSIRTYRLFTADTFLSLILCFASIPAKTFPLVTPLYPFSLSLSLIISILFLIYIPFLSTVLWSTI